MTLPRRSAALLVALALTGCASSMSGVGGHDAYGCKAPAGVQCTSVSGVYANTHASAPRQIEARPSDPTRYAASVDRPAAGKTVGSPMPRGPDPAIRSNPRVLKVWIAPWEDSDGDLNEAALIHVIVDPGRWLIEHVRPVSRRHVDAVRAPITDTAEAASAPTRDTAPSQERLPQPPGAEATTTRATPGNR